MTNKQLRTLEQIFGSEKGVFIEERQSIKTGRVTYGVVATRPIHLKETMELVKEGFTNEFIGSPGRGQLLIILGCRK